MGESDLIFSEQKSIIKEKNVLFQTVLNTSPNCIYVKDKEGRYLLANRAIADLYKTTPEEMLGKKDIDFAEQASLKPLEANFFKDIDTEVIQTKKKKIIECEPFTWNDGTIHYFHTTKIPIKYGNKTNCVMGVSVDITNPDTLKL